MAMVNSEANWNLRIPILRDEEHEQTLCLEAKNKPKMAVHRFYFVKFWPYKDPDEASKIAEAEQSIEKLDQKLNQMHQEHKLLTLEWKDKHSQVARQNNRKFSILYGLERQKRMLDHLQLDLDKLNLACKIPHKHKGVPNHTQGFKSRISHGSSNLVTERKLLNEMARNQHRLNDLDLSSSSVLLLDQLISYCKWGVTDNRSKHNQMLEKLQHIEDIKNKALADYAENSSIFNPLTLRNAIEEQIKIVKQISLEIRVEQREVEREIERLEKQLIPIKEKHYVYFDERKKMLKRKEAAQHCISKLRQTFVEMNGMYDEYVSLLSNAGELAASKDIAALRKLSHHQVEEFMSEWNHPFVKTFRRNYESNVLDSLRDRGLSHDGRIEFQNDDQETLRYVEDGSDTC